MGYFNERIKSEQGSIKTLKFHFEKLCHRQPVYNKLFDGNLLWKEPRLCEYQAKRKIGQLSVMHDLFGGGHHLLPTSGIQFSKIAFPSIAFC